MRALPRGRDPPPTCETRGVQHFLETWGYLAVFVLTVLESACIPIPSEVTLGMGGALASGAVIGGTRGDLNLGLVIVVGIAGSIVGSLIAYAVGRTGGRALVDRYGRYVLLSHADLDKAEAWFARRGEWMVLYGRVLPFVRTFISLPAGMAEMNVAKFTLLTAVGVSAWVTLLSSIGYALGDSWNSMVAAFGYAGYVVGGAVVVLIVGFLVHRYREGASERRSDRPDGAPVASGEPVAPADTVSTPRLADRVVGRPASGEGVRPVVGDVIDDRLIGALHLRSLTRRGLDHDPVREHLAVQAGTLQALIDGGYQGDATLGEVLRLGDLGIGTVQQLGGELIVLDGEPWLAEADGTVHRVDASTTTPFAVVCRFRPERTAMAAGPLSLAALQATLEGMAPPGAPVVAVRVDGTFSDLTLRSVERQMPPFRPLREVVAHQIEWRVPRAVGTLVGFRFPDATAGVEVPGYHLHFLSDDRTVAGHVLALTAGEVTLSVDRCDDLHVELPAGAGLGVPGAADRDEIARLEGARPAGDG